MIKLLFERQGAYFGFTIHGKVIKGVMGKYILPYQPSDLAFVKKTSILSRNKIPAWFIGLFTLTAGEQKQYDEAKGEEELCAIIEDDAKRENAKLISKTGGTNETTNKTKRK